MFPLFVDPRDFTQDRHRTVDDRPYGGGPGMVMMVQPPEDAINAAKERQRQSAVTETKVIYLSPQGKPLDHRKVMELKDLPGLILLCGRYEAVDQRLIDSFVDEEISMGDFVLSGGEIPAMALMVPLSASCQAFCMMNCRQWKTVLFREFSTGPHYTRPPEYKGVAVPDILTGGNHAEIEKWRRQQALLMTPKEKAGSDRKGRS